MVSKQFCFIFVSMRGQLNDWLKQLIAAVLANVTVSLDTQMRARERQSKMIVRLFTEQCSHR